MTGPIERIAIVGTGAMGGMYAAHFARAGFEVELVARGERAERQLACGMALADASAASGFADQSHMTRAFSRFRGYTPGQFAAAR